MALEEEILAKKKEISTDGYPMSIGELISLYKEGELDIHPEFQRFFRWTSLQKTKLIESILLGIPIPSIFVSQREDGVWDVVDGLQRLSTIFEFLGILKNEKDEILPPSVLLETEYLPSLNNMKWDNEDVGTSFSHALRLSFKREKIDVKIVKKESDATIKFELFQRLNTLGSKLSDQEVRNCLLVMLNKPFYEWLKRLSDFPPFLNTILLTDKAIDEQYNMELALRFLIFKIYDSNDIKYTKEISDYLTEKMLILCQDTSLNLEEEEMTFKRTFEILDFSMSEQAFKRYNKARDRFEGKFLLSAFETIAVGLGKNVNQYSKLTLNEEMKLIILNKVKDIWDREEYQSKSGSGVRANYRIPVIIPLGVNIFKYEDS